MAILPAKTCLCFEWSHLVADVRSCVPTAMHASSAPTVVWKRRSYSIGIDFLSPFGIDPTNPSILLWEATLGSPGKVDVPRDQVAHESFFSAVGRTALDASVDASARARESNDDACVRGTREPARTSPFTMRTWSAPKQCGVSSLLLHLERRNSRTGDPSVHGMVPKEGLNRSTFRSTWSSKGREPGFVGMGSCKSPDRGGESSRRTWYVHLCTTSGVSARFVRACACLPRQGPGFGSKGRQGTKPRHASGSPEAWTGRTRSL